MDRGCGFRRRVAWSIVTIWLLGSVTTDTRQGHEDEDTVARAIKLLPRQPDSIVLVDAGPARRSFHRPLEHVEDFVTQGKRVVYLVREGVTLQHARKGPGIFDYAVAIIIWHEMAHIEGADEANARREEEALWEDYVRDGRVDAVRGLKYLKLLQARR